MDQLTSTSNDPLGDFINEKLAAQERRDFYSLGGAGGRGVGLQAMSGQGVALAGQDADLRLRARAATNDDLAGYAAAARSMEGLDLRRIFQPADPNNYVIGAFLDGTWNKRGGGGLADARPGIDSTNVGLLEWMSNSTSPQFVTKCFQGVRTDSYTKLFGRATGAGVTARTAESYKWMADKVNAIYLDNPNATFDFSGVGFSRGSLETRMLLRSIDQQGIPNYSPHYEVMVGEGQLETRYARDIIEPGKANLSAVLFERDAARELLRCTRTCA